MLKSRRNSRPKENIQIGVALQNLPKSNAFREVLLAESYEIERLKIKDSHRDPHGENSGKA
jgi:hypothetical protein